MKILLIYPSYTEQTTALTKLFRDKIPPLGLLCIASTLEQAGHQVKIIDGEADNLDLKEIGEMAKDYQPQLIGISTTTPFFKKVRQTAKYFKKILPDTPIVLGGPHLASFPKISLEFKEIDYGVVGEGEITVCELARALEKNEDLAQVKGIVYRRDGEIVMTEPRELVDDLDTFPLPAWHLGLTKKYKQILSRKRNFATIISSRGCPFNCIYCDPEGRFGKKFRGRSAQNLLEEMELLHDKFRVKEITFYDDTFTFDRQRIIDLCQKLIVKKWDLIWECRTRVNLVDEELIKLMAKAGCCRIRFGVESGNKKILQVLKKGITKDQAREAFALAKRYGIETFAYFMMGSPEEDEETLQDSIDFAKELNPAYAMFSPTMLFNKGNELFYWAVDRGYIQKDYWDNFVRDKIDNPWPLLETEKLNKETVLKYVNLGYRQFYLRPHSIVSAFKQVRHPIRLVKYIALFFLLVLNKLSV